MGVGGEEIRPVCENGEKKAHSYSVVEEGLDPCPGGGESFDEGETGLGQGNSVGEVVLGVERRGEPVAGLSNHSRGLEDEAVQSDGGVGEGGPLAGGPPVDEFCFRS